MDASKFYATRVYSEHQICLWKEMALRQESQAICENQLISSHRFAQYLKQCCTQNSERLLRTPVSLDEKKDRLRKIAGSTENAVSVDKCSEDWEVSPHIFFLSLCLWRFLFRSVTKSGGVKRKGRIGLTRLGVSIFSSL